MAVNNANAVRVARRAQYPSGNAPCGICHSAPWVLVIAPCVRPASLAGRNVFQQKHLKTGHCRNNFRPASTLLFIAGLIAAILLLMSTSASADNIQQTSLAIYKQLQQQGVSYVSDISTQEHDWKLIVHADKASQYLSIFDQRQPRLIYQFSLQDVTDQFISQTVIERNEGEPPLLATVWQRGVHGEQFILHDPVNHKILYRIASSWPLHYEECEDGIAITITGDMRTDGTPQLETHYWYSQNTIKIYPGEQRCNVKQGLQRISPDDESHLSPALTGFMQAYDKAIKTRDFAFILSIIATSSPYIRTL